MFPLLLTELFQEAQVGAVEHTHVIHAVAHHHQPVQADVHIEPGVFVRDVPVRMRAGFFPFVEPGFEIDMGCLVCGGKGCSVCKHVGWIEVMPGGTPHPNVLKAAGLDPNEYTGFYVNIGLDRLVMMRYGVDDVRLFHSADLRFLEQFR